MKITIVILFMLCALTRAESPKFDALGAAPTPIPAITPAAANDRATAQLRQTYHMLTGLYRENARVMIAEANTLTPAQRTEFVTVQWLIHNILKSINPALALEAPALPATVPTPTPKPTVTPKKK